MPSKIHLKFYRSTLYTVFIELFCSTKIEAGGLEGRGLQRSLQLNLLFLYRYTILNLFDSTNYWSVSLILGG